MTECLDSFSPIPTALLRLSTPLCSAPYRKLAARWRGCGGEMGGTGEAEMGQTIGSISPDCIFFVFNYP